MRSLHPRDSDGSQSRTVTGSAWPLLLLAVAAALQACAVRPGGALAEVPIRVRQGLLQQEQPETLGLSYAPGLENSTIYRPRPQDNRYAHGVVLIPFRGKLYAQWQTSRTDEDGPDTHVVYGVSDDGMEWSQPRVLAPADEAAIRTSGGWSTDGDVLVAYINVWTHGVEPRGGHTVFRSSRDGERWSEPTPVTDAHGDPVRGVIEQDPRWFQCGHVVGAFHLQPGLQVSPAYTGDPLGVSAWTPGQIDRLPHDDPSISRAIEPGIFRRRDGSLVMVFRDQASSFRKIAAVSRDCGRTWTQPVVTDVPDSRSKQSAGNLPDGTAFIVSNPKTSKERFPLVVLLSDDGELFDRAFLLRSGSAGDLQAMRYPGRYKRAGFSYPKSVIWRDYLYVGYATNKEDVEVTRVPVRNLQH